MEMMNESATDESIAGICVLYRTLKQASVRIIIAMSIHLFELQDLTTHQTVNIAGMGSIVERMILSQRISWWLVKNVLMEQFEDVCERVMQMKPMAIMREMGILVRNASLVSFGNFVLLIMKGAIIPNNVFGIMYIPSLKASGRTATNRKHMHIK
jgi:hypothetical protein